MSSGGTAAVPARTSPGPKPAVLVCGLGSLGAHCILALKSYDVPVRGLDLEPIEQAQHGVDIGEFPFSRGDCRYADVLQRAGVLACQAVLLVTGNTYANIEGALAARRLSSSIRIVARTSQHNINELLSSLLGNFVAYEPNGLAGGAFALAAMGADILGYFHVDKQLIRIMQRRVVAADRWIGRSVERVNAHGVAVLQHLPRTSRSGKLDSGPPAFARGQELYGFDPGAIIAEGDVLTLVVGEESGLVERPIEPAERGVSAVDPSPARSALTRWLPTRRTSAVVLGALLALLTAVCLATLFFPAGDSSLSRADAMFTALVLMTGGTYADLFPPFHHLSDALRLFSVLLSVIGTVAVGLVYAWLTDQLMTARLRLGPRRPHPPRTGHILVVGLGHAGRHTAEVLRDLGARVAAVESGSVDDHALPHVAIVNGDGTDQRALEAAGVAGACGVVAATNNDWSNLEIALLARKLNPQCEVVIRTKDTRFSANVSAIVRDLRVICVPVLVARAFAIAALGKNVLDLFRLGERSIYVVEFRVEHNDGLHGRLLVDVAEGYGVVPMLVDSPGIGPKFWSPTDRAICLAPGDRVVLFGPSESLERIERGAMRPGDATLTLQALRPFADKIVVAALLAQQLAYPLERAQSLLSSLPTELPERLHPHHAYRLRDALDRSGVIVELGFATAQAPVRGEPRSS